MLSATLLHRRACRVLPEVIGTSGLALPDRSPPALCRLLHPLRRPREGLLAFRLTPDTALALRVDPYPLLRQAHAPRKAPTASYGIRYQDWRALDLAGLRSYSTVRGDGRASILLMPDGGLALYAWSDRALSEWPQ